MNRFSDALLVAALLAAGCAPNLETRCSAAADCPSGQCVAGRCLAPATPEPDAERPDPTDASEVPEPPQPDAALPPLPVPDAALPPPPVPDAALPPPPDPDAALPPPPDPDAGLPPPPLPDAFAPPLPELCDGVDQDGDGDTDEDFENLGAPCTAGIGACAVRGVEICTPDGLGTICDAVAGGPADELCNGLDDDCDGETDEGVMRPFARDFDRDGYGSPEFIEFACEPPIGFVDDQTDCDDRNPAAYPDQKERCNGFDDDCDDTVDVDETGAPVVCGVPHGASVCVEGMCAAPVCASGWHDFDARVENGCERGCDDGGEGELVGAPGDGPTETMAVAGDAPGIVWVDDTQAPEGRIHFVAGPVTNLVGRPDAIYHSPSLSPAPGGFVAAAVRNIRIPESNLLGAAQGVVIGIGADGATTFEGPLSNLDGATAIATTRTAAGRDVALVAVGPAGAGLPTMDVSCVDLTDRVAGQTRAIALPAAAAPARPVIRDLGGRFAVALPSGNSVLLVVIEADCQVPGVTEMRTGHLVSSAGLGVTQTPDGRRTIAVVTGVNGLDATIGAIDLSNPLTPAVVPGATEHLPRPTGYGCPASVVPTAGGFWVYSCEELPGARGFGVPLDFEGRRVGDAQFVVRPPANGGAVDFMRASATVGGAGLVWMLAPVAGVRGPIRQARLTCE